MASSQPVWVKIEGEDDEKAEEFSIWAGMTVSAFKILYTKARSSHLFQAQSTASLYVVKTVLRRCFVILLLLTL
jgi:hypothetical protein